MSKRALEKLKPGDKIRLNEAVVVTVRYVEDIDAYTYHDAPYWVQVHVEEFDLPLGGSTYDTVTVEQ